jgi:hypothetical protein
MALSVGADGEQLAEPVSQHYKDNSDFLARTVDTVIYDTVNNQKSQITLAIAIDRLQPCNWNFARNLVIILKAIGGDLHPDKPFACCERNVLLTSLRYRLKVISDTLRAFRQDRETDKQTDGNILALFGAGTEVKYWLAASLDKTIRSQLDPVNVKRMSEWVETWIETLKK